MIYNYVVTFTLVIIMFGCVSTRNNEKDRIEKEYEVAKQAVFTTYSKMSEVINRDDIIELERFDKEFKKCIEVYSDKTVQLRHAGYSTEEINKKILKDNLVDIIPNGICAIYNAIAVKKK